MTEITNTIDTYPKAIQTFVLKWGDMGSQWGVNRSVAQIHALLYISERPLNAEQISETLGIARSNVSNSLKELQTWRIIEREPIPGDRRDHFIAELDIWEVARRIATVRKQREIDPARQTLLTCVELATGDTRVSKEQLRRLEAMQDFTGKVDRWYGQMLRVSTPILLKLVSMGDRVVNLVAGPQKPPKKKAR